MKRIAFVILAVAVAVILARADVCNAQLIRLNGEKPTINTWGGYGAQYNLTETFSGPDRWSVFGWVGLELLEPKPGVKMIGAYQYVNDQVDEAGGGRLLFSFPFRNVSHLHLTIDVGWLHDYGYDTLTVEITDTGPAAAYVDPGEPSAPDETTFQQVVKRQTALTFGGGLAYLPHDYAVVIVHVQLIDRGIETDKRLMFMLGMNNLEDLLGI